MVANIYHHMYPVLYLYNNCSTHFLPLPQAAHYLMPTKVTPSSGPAPSSLASLFRSMPGAAAAPVNTGKARLNGDGST